MPIAAIDIGTNSARLLVTDDDGRELERTMRITRLGQGVDSFGALHPEAVGRTLAVLTEYGQRARELGARRIRAAATSAARDAGNRDEFFEAAERALGVRPELLSGEEEARLSFRGATSELQGSEGPFLVVDIGGGSTEFIVGDGEPEAVVSTRMGCVRMTERHLTDDPPTSAQLEACFADVRRELESVRRLIDLSKVRTTIGLAGTVSAIAGLELGLREYDARRTHGSVLRRGSVESHFARLSTANVSSRRNLLAQPERAEVIVGGTAVLVTVFREFAIDSMRVSERDLLDGLAASLRV